VKLLPECADINPDKPETLGCNRTALTEATRKGHDGVVGLLRWGASQRAKMSTPFSILPQPTAALVGYGDGARGWDEGGSREEGFQP